LKQLSKDRRAPDSRENMPPVAAQHTDVEKCKASDLAKDYTREDLERRLRRAKILHLHHIALEASSGARMSPNSD
jgi:hypothetical protein